MALAVPCLVYVSLDITMAPPQLPQVRKGVADPHSHPISNFNSLLCFVRIMSPSATLHILPIYPSSLLSSHLEYPCHRGREFFKRILNFVCLFVCLYMRDIERGRDIGRGRSRLPAGSLVLKLIPGPQDHDLSQRQTLNH